MFDLSSKYYDVMYSFKDYEKEAESIRNYIAKQGLVYHTILDVACGTAQHAFFLKKDYAIDGIDLNPEFVSIAKSKNPEGSFYCANMISFELHKKYDVVMCLFSSIGYVQTLDQVVRTLVQMKEHLNKDGIILIEPWITPDHWSAGRVDTMITELNGIKMCRMSHSEKHDRTSILRFDYLFGSKTGIEHFTEEHKMGLFTVAEFMQAFNEAELEVEYDEKGISGRGMYVARKRDER